MATKYFMNGGVDSNWSTDGNWSTTASTGPANTTKAVNGDAAILNAGSPSCVIDVASACTSIVCTGYTQTLTFTSTLTCAGTVTLASGMTIAGTADLICNTTATLTSGGKTLTGGLQLKGTSQTFTLSGAWIVTGALTLSGTTAITVNSSTLSVAGSLTVTTNTSGTTVITMTGGTWSGASTLKNSLTLAGNITVSGTVKYNTGTLTYSSGTITTTSSTLYLTSGTLATNGMTWNIIYHYGAGTLTCSNNCLTTTLTISNDVGGYSTTFAGAGILSASSCSITGAGHGVHCDQHVQINGITTLNSGINFYNTSSKEWRTWGLTQAISSAHFQNAGILVFNGTGSWISNAALINVPVVINTAGTFTLSGTGTTTSTITYIAGTLAGVSTPILNTFTVTFSGFTGSTAATGQMPWVLRINNTATLSTVLNVNNTIIIAGNVTFTGAFTVNCTGLTLNGITLTISNTWNVTGTLLVQTTSSTINGAFTFNIYSLNATQHLSGTTTIIFNGTGSWNGTGAIINNNMNINTAGTLTIGGVGTNWVNFATGTLTWTAGAVTGGDAGGYYTIVFTGSCTINWPTTAYLLRTAYFNTAATYTITALQANTIYLGEAVANTFAGVGFTCMTLTHMALTGNRTHTFVNGQTYRVTNVMNLGTTGFVLTLTSNHATNKFNLVLNNSATQNVGLVTAVRIDSSAGQTIYDFRGTLTSTINWTTTAPVLVGLNNIGFS